MVAARITYGEIFNIIGIILSLLSRGAVDNESVTIDLTLLLCYCHYPLCPPPLRLIRYLRPLREKRQRSHLVPHCHCYCLLPLLQWASYQLGPKPQSTFRGTSRSMAPSISATTIFRRRSTSSSGVSNSSSSWICRIIRERKFSSSNRR